MSASATPRISVLLPVYNGERYLAAAIDSILNQRFADFELLILNDGSRDGSADIARRYDDQRIRYVEHPNQGLPATLNSGARLARGEFLFRQDQDDISMPTRFEHQLAFLDTHPDVGLLGSWARIFRDGDTAAPRFHRHPTGPAAIAFNLLFDTPFVHSTIAIRRNAFEAVGGYSTDRERQPPEDYELWSRMSRTCLCANLPEVLLDYREVPGSMSRTLQAEFALRMGAISTENIEHWLTGTEYLALAADIVALYRTQTYTPPGHMRYSDIQAAITFIAGKIKDRYGDEAGELDACVRNALHQLRRKYYLARCTGQIDRFVVKAGFRILGAIRG